MTRTHERNGRTRRHPLARAALLLVGVGALYAASSAVLGASGAVPTAPVVPGADVDNYYFWQMIFSVPFVLAVGFITAGVLLAFAGTGSGRGPVMIAAARAWAWPLLVAWVPSGVEAAFMALGMGQGEWVAILSEPGFWQTAYLAFYLMAAALAVRGFVRAARAAHPRSWPAALVKGLAASAAAILAYVALIR
jgi:hypothetical protein